MPDITAIPADSNGHRWALHFDRFCCADCGTVRNASDDNKPCPGAVKVRPRAAIRQLRQTEGRA